jgi:hypothetical protein
MPPFEPRRRTLPGVIDPTLSVTLAGALDAYERLVGLGEEIDDEWSYVNDLAAAWRDRLDALDQARGLEPAGPAAPAIERAIVEIDRITDPHRAIDWLSTFPQVVLIAVGERP